MKRKRIVYWIHVFGLLLGSLAIGGVKFFDLNEPFLTRPGGFWIFFVFSMLFLTAAFWVKDNAGSSGNQLWDDDDEDDYEEKEYHNNRRD